MELNFTQVSKNEGTEQTFSFKHDCTGLIIDFNREDVKILEPIIVEGKMICYDEKITVNICIKTLIERICSCCLISYGEEIDISNQFTFVNQYHENYDEEFITYHTDSYNIDAIVMDEVASQITMKPLCTVDCKGLCPKCGNNKNETDCNCQTNEIDPRLEILSKLLKQN